MNMPVVRLLLFVTLLFPGLSAMAANITGWEGKQLMLQPLPNSSPWIHAFWEGEYYTGKISGDRLFRSLQPETVHVRKVNLRDKDIELELEGAHLGRGKIRFENGQNWPELVWDEMLSLLFTGEGVPERPRFVGYRSTHFLHFRGSNHHPPPEETVAFTSEAQALQSGYTLCPLCYKRFPGFSGFDVERQIAAFQAASIRSWGPPVLETTAQDQIQQAGKAVLENWPLPLKGYRYRFTVVDSDILNAAAVADGQIYMTKALFDSLETEEELQAILAHEIAHVEMRHTWRQ